MSRWSVLVALILLAGACSNSDLGEVLAVSDEAGEVAADQSGAASVDSQSLDSQSVDSQSLDSDGDGEESDGASAANDEAVVGDSDEPEDLSDCSKRPFNDAFLFGDRWCWDDWAYGAVDVLGGDGVGYTAFRAQWMPVRSVAFVGELELGNLINAGLPLDAAQNICEQMAADGAAAADGCEPGPNPSSLALVAVQTLLDGGDVSAFGSAEGIEPLTALVSEVPSGHATLNTRTSYAAGGSIDGCWLEGDVALTCAVDIRGEDQLITSTIAVGVNPQGVTGPDFEGFTGVWEIAGATADVEPTLDALTLSIYGLSGFESETQLGTVIERFGGEVDTDAASPVQGACFIAAGRGFPGLQFLVEGADSGDPLDGIVKGYISLSPDYGTPSGIRPGSQRFDVTDALGIQLDRVDGSGLAGYWLDFRAEDPAEQDVTVRFEIGIDDLVSMVAAGERAVVANADCGHLENGP